MNNCRELTAALRGINEYILKEYVIGVERLNSCWSGRRSACDFGGLN